MLDSGALIALERNDRGVWAALKSMHETVESTGVIDGSLDRIQIITPTDFAMPEGGLNIRLLDTILGQEARLYDFKRDAMLAFVAANKIISAARSQTGRAWRNGSRSRIRMAASINVTR